MKKVIVSLLFLVISFFSGYFLCLINFPYKNYPDKVIIEIKKGESGKEISKELQSSGVIYSEKVFYFLIRVLNCEKKLKSGYYIFKHPMSMLEVKRLLTKGPNFFIKITVTEGENFFDIERKLKDSKYLKVDDFKNYYKRVDLLKGITEDARNLEGYLFPDTYIFPPGYTSLQIINAMISNFKKKALPLILQYKGKKKVHEIVTIASLIEKETSVEGERAIISSVFYNRLKKGMKLQCDPTVIYAKILSGQVFDGKIYQSDLKRKSPYNTYFIRGLPPGPICNPGLRSIEAACNPAKTKFLYFVARSGGGHIFSLNLNSHLKAVKRYRKGKKMR